MKGVVMNMGGGIISGVAVMTAGVMDGIGDWTGNGCGATPNESQDVSKNAISVITAIFFMLKLYCLLNPVTHSHCFWDFEIAAILPFPNLHLPSTPKYPPPRNHLPLMHPTGAACRCPNVHRERR